ncbi:A-kinase anchor protein 1, mitochondrial [Varanus komodoensis]|uniref:A-kinase anchoring protein 1 n=1 Tax=Varanus komodoensis TaxID=61221 RepID=A0A8D2LW90_VARKO|nr:A-kinase anchor protein 1, mitochondrial [Varanus komodoensis]XP_044285946.1 A-kinase anchor protein 1, mitochondrial [Varanus komodoensis]XP_044285948.1 A-kinase anchor protein 1, mitochondrial [Varanus komodoensis]
MALRFRTFLPFAIPGVLALIGWWWFSLRKKEHASNHGRRGSASLLEQRVGSPKRAPCSKEDTPLDSEFSAPQEAAQPFEPSADWPSTEHSAQGGDSSRGDRPVVPKAALGSGALGDDSGKLEVLGCPSVSGPPVPESSIPDVQVAEEESLPCQLREERASTQVAAQVLSATLTALQTEASSWEKSGACRGPVAARDVPSAQSVKDDRRPVPSGDASWPAPSPDVAKGALPDPPSEAAEVKAVNGSVVGEAETEAGVTDDECVGPASSELAQEVKTSRTSSGSALKNQAFGEVGRRSSSEKDRAGGIALDKEEVEKIEEVAIHIISNVIRAATEEVLSASVPDVSDRMCQTPSHAEEPTGNVPAASCQGDECSADAVEPSPLSEENVSRYAIFSSQLMHGRLVNPNFGPPRDSVCAVDPTSTTVGNHEEEFEDPHTATDSGCSACTSEDGVSAEDLLKSSSSPALGQLLDSLSVPSKKDSEHKSASGKKPPCPAVAEDKAPYSNGTLKDGCPALGCEPPWPAEIDGDHSGGSDVNSMDSVDSDCALQKNGNSKVEADSGKIELVIWEIEVPKHLVGRLIGKQGRYVSFLKQVSGAKIYIFTLPYTQDFQICHIEGSQQNVDKALSLIGKKFKDLSLNNIYAPPPPPLPLHSLPMTSWLMLPDGVTVEVIVVNQVNAGHLFVQQHTHPTFHVLRNLDQQMYLCYSQPGIPTMPTPVEVGVVCAAPGMEGAWWRAQVVGYFEDTNEVEIRYVDYGGYERVKVDMLRQIRSDFVTLPFQGAEVLLDNVVPLPDDDHFSSEADTAVSEMTRGTPLLAQVTNYDSATGLPLIQLWSMIGDELVSINRTLVERGFAQWVENY